MDNFKCQNCGHRVSGRALGTQNRNHCPSCLYSRHLDLKKPGDRSSRCGELMKPLGLSTKADGELCLVHQCLACGTVSKNRLAGDDDAETVLKIYRQGDKSLVNLTEREIITQLFGKPNVNKYLPT